MVMFTIHAKSHSQPAVSGSAALRAEFTFLPLSRLLP